MKHLRRRFVIAPAASLAALVSLGAAAVAFAQAGRPPVSFSIYRGEDQGNSNVTLGAWGSGRAEQVKENALAGDSAIRVTTHGLYQGARLDFKNPVDLSSAFTNPNTFLRMQVRFSGNSQLGGADPNDPFVQRVLVSPFERMRFLLTMQDGTQYELVRPVSLPPSEDPDSYVPITFPVSAILKKDGKAPAAPPTGDAAKLKSIAIFGDIYQQFLIGEINVTTDDTDIDVADLEEQIAFANDELTFVGNAEGGASTLKFSWDFDSRDGIQEDAVGRTVTHVYRSAGERTVTLTVSDVDGTKPSKTATVKLEVSQ